MPATTGDNLPQRAQKRASYGEAVAVARRHHCKVAEAGLRDSLRQPRRCAACGFAAIIRGTSAEISKNRQGLGMTDHLLGVTGQ